MLVAAQNSCYIGSSHRCNTLSNGIWKNFESNCIQTEVLFQFGGDTRSTGIEIVMMQADIELSSIIIIM